MHANIPAETPTLLSWRWALLGVVAVAAAFVAASWLAGGDELIPPLDDTYIHLQYARNLAHGNFYSFLEGGPYSTGDTAPLYVVLLAPAFWLGLDGSSAMVWVFLLNAVLHLATIVLGLKLAHRFGGSRATQIAALALLLLWGPWLWGVYLGMEVALAALLLLLMVYTQDGVHLSRRARIARFVALAALPLVRPEGLFLSALAILMRVVRRETRGSTRQVVFQALTLAPFAGYMVANRILTGTFKTAGYLVKAASESPDIGAVGLLPHVAEWLQFLITKFFLSPSFEYLPPFAAVWIIVGLASKIKTEGHSMRLGGAHLILLWWLVGLGLVSLAWFPDVTRGRYLLPMFPLYLVAIAMAWGKAWHWLEEHRGIRATVTLVVLFALAQSPIRSWGDFHSDAREIAHVQVRLARWIDHNLPDDTLIGLHDAGALVYLGQRRAIDFVGLGTAEFARPFRNGDGSVFEAIERLPVAGRPDYWVTCRRWLRAPVLGEVVAEASIARAEIIPATTFFVYRADYTRLDPAVDQLLRPDLPLQWDVVDRVDVADIVDECAHGYHNEIRDRLMQETNVAQLFSAGGRDYADGGRLVFARERFSIEIDPDREFAIFARFGESNGRVRVSLQLSDGQEGLLELQPDQPFGEPGSIFQPSSEANIEVVAEPVDGHPYKSLHYWVLQPSD